MSDERALVINRHLTIPSSELTFRATRSGGPGGQHVNTSSTRIELLWNAARSRALSGEDRARVLDKLASRLDSDGSIRVVSSEHRSQARNRTAACERLVELVRRALVVRPPRKGTRPTRSAVERRLADKKRRGDVKRIRRSDPHE